MANTDPIADFITRLRNAQKAKHQMVSAPSSKMKEKLAEIMKREGYITDFEVQSQKGPGKTISVKLRYDRQGNPMIRSIVRMSKPGYRRYVSTEKLTTLSDVITTTIISTSRGIMTDREAKDAKIGGEVICQIS